MYVPLFVLLVYLFIIIFIYVYVSFVCFVLLFVCFCCVCLFVCLYCFVCLFVCLFVCFLNPKAEYITSLSDLQIGQTFVTISSRENHFSLSLHLSTTSLSLEMFE